jgi:transposase
MPDRKAQHKGIDRAEFYARPLSSPAMEGEAAAACNTPLAEAFLVPWLWPDGQRRCPRCGQENIYDLADGRMRCPECRYTFTAFNGRWINTGNISAADWIFLTRLFVEGFNVLQASEASGLSYNAMFKAFTALRFSILARGTDAPQMFGVDTGLFQYIRNKRIRFLPRTAQIESSPVFGIIEREGWVFTDIIAGYQYDTLFHLNLSFNLPLARVGNIVYTGRFRQYQTLLSCSDKTTNLPMPQAARKLDIETDSDSQSFWQYAMDRLKHFKGITSTRLPLYLKEIEFRYNYAAHPLMPMLLERLCDPVPELNQELKAYTEA